MTNVEQFQNFLMTTGTDLLVKVLAALAFWIVGRWLIAKFRDDAIDPCREYWYYVEGISTSGNREKFTPTFRAPPKRRAADAAAATTAAPPAK